MGVQPALHEADADGAAITRASTSSRSSRVCNSTSVRRPQFMDFRYTRARSLARRVPPRPLRRVDGRRTDGRGLRPRRCATTSRTRRSTPPHRRPTAGAGPPDPPSAATPADRHPHCALDGDHRRVASRDRRPPGDSTSMRRTRAATTELDPIDPMTKGSPTTRASWCPTSTSRSSHIRRWCGSPTRSACRCIC